jgi:integrase
MRSLFSWAKANGIIFKNPANRIPGSPRADRLWQPLAPDQIESSIQAAATPHARLAIALAAVHAARHGQIRALQLSDIDLANRRLAIAGRSRPLDDLTLGLLTEWLDYRRSHWPGTANPHLLISRSSAVGLGPVSAPWIGRMLRGLPATIEQLRIDRQLEEALCSGADPLHIKAVFGMDDSTAIRYATGARQLLSGQGAGGTSSHPMSPPGAFSSQL